jgi:nucleoside phosphorylase
MTQPEPVVVRQFMSTVDAELAQGALHAAGIDAMVSADDCGGMRPHLQVGRVALLVRPEDVEEATRILDLPAEELS